MTEIIIFLFVAVPVAIVLSIVLGLAWLFKDLEP